MSVITEKKVNDLIFDKISSMGHEQVVFCHDEKTGLRAIIAIHNTVLGPALGGTRMWQYASDIDAIVDALRLSEGMTYKAAVAGLNLGGGKAVIIGDSRKDKSEAYFRRYGKFVDSLGGKYITAEDVGTSKADMEYIAMETDHVSGLPEHKGGSGDPSPVTAYGVYMGVKASAKKVYGNDSLSGKKVMVQGAGNVGRFLIDNLMNEGAVVYVTDIFEDQLQQVTTVHPSVKVIAPEEVYDLDMDIYAPCALGATLNDDTIPRLKCAIVAGGANNQLQDTEKHMKMLMDRGILYAPDFVINAGGLINVYSELEGYNRQNALSKTEYIYNQTLAIFEAAGQENISTLEASLRIAKRRIDAIADIKTRI
ncbi:MAG: Glu/Leu/Phe/Val dehydrogenase dimerization domain-containing protein [Bacteroidia bacterium]